MDVALIQKGRLLPLGASHTPDFISQAEEDEFEKRLDVGV